MSDTFIPRDTTPEAFRVYCQAQKNLGSEGRMRLVVELSRQLRERLEAGVRLRHPEYTDHLVRLGRIRLQLGDKLFREVYGELDVKP